MEKKYEKILHMPRHISPTRRKMDIGDRAAQFAPYAALSGFGDVVDETSRLTEERTTQDEGEIEKINRALVYILSHNGRIKAKFTYFVKDDRKSGGHYITLSGYAIEFDEIKRNIVLVDNTTLPIDDLVKIEFL